MLKHFIRIAWRNIKRRKSLSAIQIICLSIGLAAFILVARYVQYEKDFDKFNANYDRIYRAQSYKIGDRTEDGNQAVIPLAKYLRENIPEVENAIVVNEVWGEYLMSDAEQLYKEEFGYLAPSAMFDVFSFELLSGNPKTALDDPNSIVLSETLAKKYFPHKNAMGEIIIDQQKNELRVTGIMRDIPEQSTINATYFRSNKNLVKEMGDNWSNKSFRIMVLLENGATVQTVNDKISNLLNEFDEDAKQVLYLQPLSKLHLNETVTDDRGAVIFFFSFIGIITLLLACVSFMNLTTSFSTLRSIEIGVRKVTGSSKKFIRLQFFAESTVLATISLVLAIFLTYLLLPLFNTVVNRNIELQYLKNPLFMLFLASTVLVTGLIAGSYPALVVSKFKPVVVLKGKNPFKKGKISGLNVMVYVQFILSLVLITSSIWTYKQVRYMKNKNLGFENENLLHCEIPEVEYNVSFKQLRQRILENPAIEDMALSNNSPMHNSWGTRIRYEGGPLDDRVRARWNLASESYLNTMGMKLVAGRNFSVDYSDDNSCLVNETAVKKFGWKDPIGKWIDKEEKYRVIGVIKDFNAEDVHNPIIPYVLLYRNWGFETYNDLTFKINPAAKETALAYINTVLSETFPNILYEVKGYDADMELLGLKIWTSAKNTFAFFTVLAVIIAALGLFGLVVFASQRKVKEIGIRKVQGAKSGQILPLITKRFLIMVIVANIIVYPAAKIMENVTPGHYKYQFSASDTIAVLVISLIITILSSGYQAFKASKLNPVKALRYE